MSLRSVVSSADAAVAAYDSYVFGCVGSGSFDAARADALALAAAEASSAAAVASEAKGWSGSGFRDLSRDFYLIAGVSA